MKTFLFFRGYVESRLLDIDWEEINRRLNTNIIPTTYIPTWTGTTYTPTWIVNPGLIQYTPNYTQYTPPNYTITTTPGTGYVTLPYNGTINTATSFSLTTSNPNGITYTTGGFGGNLTTDTATFRSGAFTTKTM
jgi:hypothetical protein